MEENVETYDNIPTAQLEMKMATFDRVSNDKVTAVIVELTYKWIKAPFFTLTDAMTFNWDGTLFALGGFYAESGYDTRDVANRYQWRQTDYVDRPAKGAEGGIGWYLKTGLGAVGSTVTVDSNNRGAASIYLVPKNTIYTSTSLKSTMFFNYAHQIVGANISLGLSQDGPSAGVDFAGGKYDEASTYIIYH